MSPKAIPQLADTEELYRRIHPASGVRYPALVPNLQGLERALSVGVREIAVFTAASETFNRKNINAGVDESIERFRPVVERAKAEKIRIRGYVSTAFGCPYEGDDRARGREGGRPQAPRPRGRRDLGGGHDRRGDAFRRLRRDRGALRIRSDARRSGAPLPRHARHGARERLCGAAVRRHDLRRLGRRPRRLSVRPGRHRAISPPRICSISSKGSGLRPASHSRKSSKRRDFSRSISAGGRRDGIWRRSGEKPVDRLSRSG